MGGVLNSQGEVITDDELSSVAALASRQAELEYRIKRGESLLDDLKKEWRQIAEHDLPNAIQEVGLSTFTLADGRKISTKTEVYASIPKDNPNKAFAWLRANGHGALIKNVISAEFGKGEDEQAVEAASALAEAGFKPSQKESVHPMTLKAFLKEQLEKGVDVPLEDFGAHIVTRAKVEHE